MALRVTCPIWAASLAGLLWGNAALAQGNGVAAKLSILSVLVEDKNIRVEYEIPYEGYVEFNVYDLKGRRLGTTAEVKRVGRHFMLLTRKYFRPGNEYILKLIYKGGEYAAAFTNGSEPVVVENQSTTLPETETPRKDEFDWGGFNDLFQDPDSTPPESSSDSEDPFGDEF